VLDQQVGHDPGDGFRKEPPVLDPDVAAIGDGRDGRGIRRRTADAVFLERLDEGRLREARRRLGEVLGRRDLLDRSDVVGDEGGQSAGLLVVRGRIVVAALGVDATESGSRRKLVGRIDSCASWAPFDLVL
jgi:hypothetical protein